jgi:hypothetical protein
MDIFVIRENTVVSYLSELLWSIVSYTVMFLCFARTTKKRGEIIPDCSIRSNIILVFLVALIMFLRFSLQYLYEFIRGTFGSYIINLALGVIPLTFLMVVVNTVIVDNLRSQNYTLNGLLHDKERQYLAAVENVDAINRKCHDIRRQLRALDFLDDKTRGQSIQEMENIVNIYDSFVKTSNAAINTLLSEKLLYCNEHKIKLTNIVDGDALQFMSPVDIYTMFGNIIDNAIEAVTKLEDAEKRIISMTVERKGNFLCIQTKNYFNGTIDLVDGLPRTSKEDKTYHGYGTRSIKHIAEKYGGSMNIQTDGEVFILQITIPIP